MEGLRPSEGNWQCGTGTFNFKRPDAGCGTPQAGEEVAGFVPLLILCWEPLKCANTSSQHWSDDCKPHRPDREHRAGTPDMGDAPGPTHDPVLKTSSPPLRPPNGGENFLPSGVSPCRAKSFLWIYSSFRSQISCWDVLYNLENLATQVLTPPSPIRFPDQSFDPLENYMSIT